MPILNGMASWPHGVESEVVEQKKHPEKLANTHARMPAGTCACACVCVCSGRVCVCVCSSVLGVGSGVKVCGKNVYYALAMAQAAKSAVNLSLLLALPLVLPPLCLPLSVDEACPAKGSMCGHA